METESNVSVGTAAPIRIVISGPIRDVFPLLMRSLLQSESALWLAAVAMLRAAAGAGREAVAGEPEAAGSAGAALRSAGCATRMPPPCH